MPPGIGVDELPLWYAGRNGAWEGPRACGLGLASVGRHAFAGYRGGIGGGTVQTAPISISTGDLRVTASGGVTMAVPVPGVPSLSHEACKPIRGTSVAVEWAGVEGGLGNFSGGALALELSCRGGGGGCFSLTVCFLPILHASWPSWLFMLPRCGSVHCCSCAVPPPKCA
eukprot:COSAG04_NODE_1329_length_7203_cov_11.591216_2_plen_170_part_00